jgi:hypothetical protein
MECKKCGIWNTENVPKCLNCGASLESNTEPTVSSNSEPTVSSNSEPTVSKGDDIWAAILPIGLSFIINSGGNLTGWPLDWIGNSWTDAYWFDSSKWILWGIAVVLSWPALRKLFGMPILTVLPAACTLGFISSFLQAVVHLSALYTTNYQGSPLEKTILILETLATVILGCFVVSIGFKQIKRGRKRAILNNNYPGAN